jgi:hypothetical protein
MFFINNYATLFEESIAASSGNRFILHLTDTFAWIYWFLFRSAQKLVWRFKVCALLSSLFFHDYEFDILQMAKVLWMRSSSRFLVLLLRLLVPVECFSINTVWQ